LYLTWRVALFAPFDSGEKRTRKRQLPAEATTVPVQVSELIRNSSGLVPVIAYPLTVSGKPLLELSI